MIKHHANMARRVRPDCLPLTTHLAMTSTPALLKSLPNRFPDSNISYSQEAASKLAFKEYEGAPHRAGL